MMQNARRQGATCWLGMALTVTRMYLAEQLEGVGQGVGASTMFSTASPSGLGSRAGDRPGCPGPGGVMLKLSKLI